MTEKRSKHRNDLANAKQISLILPDYISPLTGVVNCDNIPWDFKYTLITAYIHKGILFSWNPFGTDPITEEQRL
jgi:hypothetical protein